MTKMTKMIKIWRSSKVTSFDEFCYFVNWPIFLCKTLYKDFRALAQVIELCIFRWIDIIVKFTLAVGFLCAAYLLFSRYWSLRPDSLVILRFYCHSSVSHRSQASWSSETVDHHWDHLIITRIPPILPSQSRRRSIFPTETYTSNQMTNSNN